MIGSHVYFFVALNKLRRAVEYFVVSRPDLSDDPERFGKAYCQTEKIPGVLPSTLRKQGYQDAWHIFLQHTSVYGGEK